jgi:hypothetical protein
MKKLFSFITLSFIFTSYAQNLKPLSVPGGYKKLLKPREIWIKTVRMR